MSDDAPRRGRPRPEETLKRDGQVLRLLERGGPLTRNDLAEALGISPQLVYLALSRLAKNGRVKRCLVDNESVWTDKVDQPCP